MDSLAHILLIAAGLIAAWKLLRAALRRAGLDRPLRRGIRRLRARPLPSQMLYAAALPRNPADGFYGIRHEGRLSLTGASLIYALFFGSFLLSKYGTAFLFKGCRTATMSWAATRRPCWAHGSCSSSPAT